VNENFFALGGDSILAVQIAFKAKQLGFTFHPVQLFRHPTIAQLETVIAAPANASNTQETVRSVAAKPPNHFRQSSRVSNY
jgi:aryl carrier-like protein